MKLVSKTIYLLFLIFPMIILLISVSTLEASQLKIEVAAVGTDVQNRSLVGKGSIFKEGSTLFFFTKVIGGEAGDITTGTRTCPAMVATSSAGATGCEQARRSADRGQCLDIRSRLEACERQAEETCLVSTQSGAGFTG